MNLKTLRTRFFPVVAFAVSCKPAHIRSADTHREDSTELMNVTCRLAAVVRPSTSAVRDNALVSGQS
jgi:hypothetical protein